VTLRAAVLGLPAGDFHSFKSFDAVSIRAR